MKTTTSFLRRALLLSLLTSSPLFAQTQQPPWWEATKISGYAFADEYWLASHHDPALEDRNGFWFRRIYLTFDQTLSKSLTGRLRFEMNHPGDFTSTAALDPFVKDAYLKWKRSDRQQFVVGTSPTPTFELIEQVWGYRSVEKAPLDLQRYSPSRDTGLAMLGNLDQSGKFQYHAMIGNGTATGADNNSGKLAALAVTWYPTKRFLVQGYGDFDDRPGGQDRTTLQGFAAWQSDRARAGLQVSSQRREVPGGDDQTLDIASVFGVLKVREKLSLLVRADRMFDPNPDGTRIAYLPFDPTSKATLLIAGADFLLHKNVNVIPNVEIVDYDSRGGSDPDLDIVPRLTLYFRF